MNTLAAVIILLAAIALLAGLKKTTVLTQAQEGITWMSRAILLAALATLLLPSMANAGWIILAIAAGAGLSLWHKNQARPVSTESGWLLISALGAAALCGMFALALLDTRATLGAWHASLLIFGATAAAVNLASCAWFYARENGHIKAIKPLAGQGNLYFFLLLFTFGLGLTMAYAQQPEPFGILIFFLLALALGILFAWSAHGPSVPVLQYWLNAVNGFALVCAGLFYGQALLVLAGGIITAAMGSRAFHVGKALQRPLCRLLLAPFSSPAADKQDAPASAADAETTTAMPLASSEPRTLTPEEAARRMYYATGRVVIIPGEGMAAASAQNALHELTGLLEENGVPVVFALHPVAGRSPGQIVCLLGQAGVNLEKCIENCEAANAVLADADVALIVGANDTVNPVAAATTDSPLHGMPTLDATAASQIFLLNLAMDTGYAGIENDLFNLENAALIAGDARQTLEQILRHIHELRG